MRNLGTTSRRPRPRPLLRVAFCCALGLGVSILTGCSSLGGDKKKVADPILGEVHPQNTAPYGPTPPSDKDKSKNHADTKTSANTPAGSLFVPSPTSNAYLATLTKPLAITDGRAPGSFHLTANSEPIVRPIPKDPAFVSNSWVAPPTSATANSSGSGQFVPQPNNFVDPQVVILQSRGITQHRADLLPDGRLRLLAVAPQRDISGQLRTFDVTARDLPEAVQAVLRQMDQGS
jgi:hypothetical protein